MISDKNYRDGTKTVVINYKFRISEFARNEIKKKAICEYRDQNTVVREILEKWAKQK